MNNRVFGAVIRLAFRLEGVFAAVENPPWPPFFKGGNAYAPASVIVARVRLKQR